MFSAWCDVRNRYPVVTSLASLNVFGLSVGVFLGWSTVRFDLFRLPTRPRVLSLHVVLLVCLDWFEVVIGLITISSGCGVRMSQIIPYHVGPR